MNFIKVRDRAIKQRMERKKDENEAEREQMELRVAKFKADCGRERDAVNIIFSDFKQELATQKQVNLKCYYQGSTFCLRYTKRCENQ